MAEMIQNKAGEESVERLLLDQQELIARQLETVEGGDPFTALDSLPETREFASDAWEADAHDQALAVSERLKQQAAEISRSLLRLELGTYGTCDSCHGSIEQGRLSALPTANTCTSCSLTHY